MTEAANDNSRRAFLRGTAAAAMLAATSGAGAAGAAAARTGASSAGPAGADAALVAAEREIHGILADMAKLPQPQTPEEVEAWSEATDALWWRLDALENLIYRTPPESLTGAAVKLRRLIDPNHGIPSGLRGDETDSLAHILAAVDRAAASRSG